MFSDWLSLNTELDTSYQYVVYESIKAAMVTWSLNNDLSYSLRVKITAPLNNSLLCFRTAIGLIGLILT